MQNREIKEAHIWLRYSTQFQRDGQSHTVEMSVPMPIGASAEQRERLIREAEEGMRQLVSHVGTRLTNFFPQSTHQSFTPAQTPMSSKHVSQPLRPTTSIPPHKPGTQDQLNRPGKSGSDQNVEGTVQISNKQNIGATMPLTLGPTLDSSGNLPLPEFIQYIRENLHLDIKQAMRMLNVKTLSGVNLREALDRLKVATGQQESRPVESRPLMEISSLPTEPIPEVNRVDNQRMSMPLSRPTMAEPQPLDISTENVVRPQVRQNSVPPRGFDEEEEISGDDLEQFIEDEEIPFSHNLTPEQVEFAHDKIDELRATQGAATANGKRLQVLANLIDQQITSEQLSELLFGLWEISNPKKLKIEQVESLISWAKQDYFIEEVESVLIVLEEERYARGNR